MADVTKPKTGVPPLKRPKPTGAPASATYGYINQKGTNSPDVRAYRQAMAGVPTDKVPGFKDWYMNKRSSAR